MNVDGNDDVVAVAVASVIGCGGRSWSSAISKAKDLLINCTIVECTTAIGLVRAPILSKSIPRSKE